MHGLLINDLYLPTAGTKGYWTCASAKRGERYHSLPLNDISKRSLHLTPSVQDSYCAPRVWLWPAQRWSYPRRFYSQYGTRNPCNREENKEKHQGSNSERNADI